jgi:putative ABC transport system permease protein
MRWLLLDPEHWLEIGATLRKHKLRTALTALGVWWGIFMLVVMMGAGKALENGTLHEFGKWNVKSLFVWSERTTVPYEGLQAGRRIRLDMDDIAAARERVRGIDELSPRLWLDVDAIVREGREGAFSVRGETDALVRTEPVRVASGRFINERDLAQRRKVIVIGQRVRDVLYAGEDPLGTWLPIRGAWFQVVGVARSLRTGDDSREDDESIFMPITTMQHTYNMVGRVGWFVCTVSGERSTAEVQAELTELLRQRHHVSPEDQQAIGSFNLEEEFLRFQGVFAGIRAIVLFVSIGTLAAGVIGVGNITLITVRERTREIGVRKALGATDGSIVSMILTESVALTALAGYLGLVAGIGVLAAADAGLRASGAETMFFRQPEVDLGFALAALGCLILAGAVAGAIPARLAAGLHPAETLKDE